MRPSLMPHQHQQHHHHHHNHQRIGGGSGASEVSTPPGGGRLSHRSPSKGIPDASGAAMRAAPSARGVARTTTQNKHMLNDRPEHPSSSLPRALPIEEGSTAAGGDPPSFGLSVASRGGLGVHRRCGSELSMAHSMEHAGGPDRRTSTRDPFQRSRDTSVSDTPSMAERGGHGRDGPVMPRDHVISNAGGSIASGGGGGTSKAGGSGIERERTLGGRGVGEDELPLEVVGRYERMRVLGRGSFGAVTLVKDNRDSKLYAMKTLNCADKLEERETAMAEVRLLRWVKHPSVLMLSDTFLSVDGRLVCLTTTYCESGDLAKIIKHAAKMKTLLGEKTVLGWFVQLCLGVHYLHEDKKVLHRDIKPNNVFLMDSKKIIQLGDFGLAKVINDGDKQVKTEVGTPYYTSPEMCNNQPYGFPSDVWSLGIVLFELLSLDVPFRSRDVVALVSQVIKAPPPALPDVYSSEATGLARWMLQKDPLRRPTLTQVLSCQPLRRHMNSFVKHYRPMNMAERQRRHDIKELEAQVAGIMERGGEDPQIPGYVDEGCGTAPADASQETNVAQRSDSKSQPLEARGAGAGGETEKGGFAGVAVVAVAAAAAAAAAAVTITAEDAGVVVGGEAGEGRKARAAERGTSSLSTASLTPDGLVSATGVEVDEAKGACTRCGARVSCACGSGGGGGGGGGSSTPGRRFGSPQQNKGIRHVMTWSTGGPIAPDIGQDGAGTSSSSGNGELVNVQNRAASWGSNDECVGTRRRRRRRPTFGDGSGHDLECERRSLRRGGSSSEESTDSHASSGPRAFDQQGSSSSVIGCDDVAHSSRAGRKRGRVEDNITRRGSNDGNRDVDTSGRRIGCDGDGSVNSTGSSIAHEAARPTSPTSPQFQSSARLKRVSDKGNPGTREIGTAFATPNKSRGILTMADEAADLTLPGGDHRPQPCTTESSLPIVRKPVGIATSTPSVSFRKLDESDEGNEQIGEARREGDRTVPSADPPPMPTTVQSSVSGTTPEGSPGVEKPAEPTIGRGVDPSEARRSSSMLLTQASAPANVGDGDGGIARNRFGISPRTPRSPRMSTSGSDTFKTARRLSEALQFAAAGERDGVQPSKAEANTTKRVDREAGDGPERRGVGEAKTTGMLAAEAEAGAGAGAGEGAPAVATAVVPTENADVHQAAEAEAADRDNGDGHDVGGQDSGGHDSSDGDRHTEDRRRSTGVRLHVERAEATWTGDITSTSCEDGGVGLKAEVNVMTLAPTSGGLRSANSSGSVPSSVVEVVEDATVIATTADDPVGIPTQSQGLRRRGTP